MEITIFSLFIYIIASIALILALVAILRGNITTLIVNEHVTALSGVFEDDEEDEFKSFAMSALEPPTHVLEKNNLNKTHIMDGGSHTIVFPDDIDTWEGEIKIVNRDNNADIVDFTNHIVSMMIVEFSGNTTGYSNEVIPIQGNSYVYQKISGKFNINNYIMHIHISAGKIVITGKCLILDNLDITEQKTNIV